MKIFLAVIITLLWVTIAVGFVGGYLAFNTVEGQIIDSAQQEQHDTALSRKNEHTLDHNGKVYQKELNMIAKFLLQHSDSSEAPSSYSKVKN